MAALASLSRTTLARDNGRGWGADNGARRGVRRRPPHLACPQPLTIPFPSVPRYTLFASGSFLLRWGRSSNRANAVLAKQRSLIGRLNGLHANNRIQFTIRHVENLYAFRERPGLEGVNWVAAKKAGATQRWSSPLYRLIKIYLDEVYWFIALQ